MRTDRFWRLVFDGYIGTIASSISRSQRYLFLRELVSAVLPSHTFWFDEIPVVAIDVCVPFWIRELHEGCKTIEKDNALHLLWRIVAIIEQCVRTNKNLLDFFGQFCLACDTWLGVSRLVLEYERVSFEFRVLPVLSDGIEGVRRQGFSISYDESSLERKSVCQLKKAATSIAVDSTGLVLQKQTNTWKRARNLGVLAKFVDDLRHVVEVQECYDEVLCAMKTTLLTVKVRRHLFFPVRKCQVIVKCRGKVVSVGVTSNNGEFVAHCPWTEQVSVHVRNKTKKVLCYKFFQNARVFV